jgi:hypothetical protein
MFPFVSTGASSFFSCCSVKQKKTNPGSQVDLPFDSLVAEYSQKGLFPPA